ncbi:MAG TPA: formate dehydrogenase accessory sulfurtransferase FdhD [Gemmatimonadales bacterium]|nr:formate dehydrogenase accessory sulfurtransferase FdhD [Gemmatimonadales bacterium]
MKPEPGSRRGRMLAESAAVEEVPVWLEVNGEPAVTWMCTPDQLEELATGWLHGEGYIESLDDLLKLRPCATDLGFWADIKPARLAAVKGENRRRVLASGCGAVSTFLADPNAVAHARVPARGEPPPPERLRALFKELFARGERYNETGGIHAAALTDNERLLFHAEDIGRHNAVDKAIGAAVIAREPIVGRGLLVTGRVSAELAYKAARAGVAYVATPSVPSTLALTIGRRSGLVLVGRAVSGNPHIHRPDA